MTSDKVNQDNILVVDGESIAQGEYKQVKLLVGRLPSDTQISILAHVYRGKEDGPVLLLQGGVHGDEINGVETIRRIIEADTLSAIKRGTVIAIPLLNVFGFINFSREVPDGKDVNRSFPGSSTGSLASRIARNLTKKILPHVEYAIDLHTGGASRYNYPQVRYSKGNKESFELANVFGSQYIIEKATIPNSFRRACKELGIPAIVYEAGESIRLNGFAITNAIHGINNVLAHFGMIDNPNPSFAHNKYHVQKTSWIRASFSGLFIWTKSSGQAVMKGEPIGFIKDPFGNKSVTVTSTKDGHIIGHNNASVVNQGDALFHIGYEVKEIE